MVIGAAFEVLSIGIVIPLIEVISDDEAAVLKYAGSFFRSSTDQQIYSIILALFVGVYILKGIYLSCLAWLIGWFTFAIKADVSNSLMLSYLNLPYQIHLQKNSSQMIRNLTTEAAQLAQSAVNPILIIFSELVVICAIGIFLLIVEPVGSMMVMILMIALSFVFHRLVSNYTSKLGKIRQNADGMIIKEAQEALGGIKDVKVLGKELHFFVRFTAYNEASAVVSAKQHTLKQIPRMYLEMIGVLVFSGLMILFMSIGYDFLEMLPTLGVFALSAFRLLPSANRILASLNSLRFSDVVVDRLSEEVVANNLLNARAKFTEKSISRLSFNEKIEIKDLSYNYSGTSNAALSRVNLSINKGESIGVIGRSGSGKSTLSDMILGLLKPSAGVILVDGQNIDENIAEWQCLIGYVQQDIFLLDDSIRRNIAFGCSESEIDTKALNAAVIDARLGDFVSSLPDGVDTQLGERGVRLSGGQKQRIGIARALYRNSPILVFDEATSALDNETESEVVSSIKRFQGVRTTIVIAHRLSTIQHCDRVVELEMGTISRVFKP